MRVKDIVEWEGEGEKMPHACVLCSLPQFGSTHLILTHLISSHLGERVAEDSAEALCSKAALKAKRFLLVNAKS